MKNLILITLVSLFFVACGTTQHDRQWFAAQGEYKAECQKWYKTVGVKKFQRKAGEEHLPVQEVMIARCSEDPSLCQPPRKPAALYYHESHWGQEVTDDYCAGFPNDFRDDRLK